MPATTAPPTLPVIDISRFRDPAADRAALLAELRYAAREVGFFYVVGHGVDPELRARALDVSRRFFALPEADRLAVENVNSPQFRGYTRTGTEYTQGGPDWREQLDIGPERDALTLGPADPAYLRLVGPNQWPAALPELREIVLAWQAEALRVSREVLRALAAALGQDTGYFDEWFDDEAAVHVKVVHYPGRPSAEVDQGWARTRTTATSRCSSRTRSAASRCRPGTARGSTRHRCRTRSCSTSARCWRSPPAATCGPPGTG